MSDNEDSSQENSESIPDLWYSDIEKRESKFDSNADDIIRQEEARSRNRIGLVIVETICNAFLLMLVGGFLIFGYMTYKGNPEDVALVIDYIKTYGVLLKDGFLPIVLVALGYFFGSNNNHSR